jgi:hypothetical protein
MTTSAFTLLSTQVYSDPAAFLHEAAAALFASLMIQALKRLGVFRSRPGGPGLDPHLTNLIALALTLLLAATAGLAVYQATGSYPLFAVLRAALLGTALATLGYEATKNALELLGRRSGVGGQESGVGASFPDP